MYFSNPDINALIKLLLDKEITICGEVKYAYAVMNKSFPKEMIIINNHDSWFNKYLQGEYQLFDPVIIKSLNRVEDFYWGKDILYHQDRGGDNIFNAGEGYSIDNGHTFVLHDNVNNLAVLSVFPGENNRDDFRAMIEVNKASLQYLLLGIHQKMLSFYHELKGSDYGQRQMLSARENEVLYWASMGKTYQEIALILDIRLRTVKFHMRNVVDKFEVANAKHAIKRAAEMRIYYR